jgi:Rieske Fe-S protein
VIFCASSHLFESPAHGEKFDIRGYYYAGPGARGLRRYPTRIEGDRVVIDLEHPTEGPERGAGPPQEPQGPFCIPT